MTRDQILAIAKQSGLATDSPYLMPRNMDAIEQFAALVAEHEREECAISARTAIQNSRGYLADDMYAFVIADTIRARKD